MADYRYAPREAGPEDQRCHAPECTRVAVCRGLCYAHYMQVHSKRGSGMLRPLRLARHDGRRVEYITRPCSFCGTPVTKQPSWMQSKNVYCCKEHHYAHLRAVTDAQRGADFDRELSELERSEGNSCPQGVEVMAEGGEVSKKRHPAEGSPKDVLTEEDLAKRLDLALQELTEEEFPTSESEEDYKTQRARLLAEIAGLQYGKSLLEMRVKTLEARTGWRPWRRE